MNHLPFGISQYTTWPLTFEQDLQLYHWLGVGNIEVCESKLSATNPQPQLQALQSYGLKVSSVQPRYHSPFPNSLRKTPTAPAERMRRLQESIRRFGRYCPGTTLVVNTGLAPGGDFATAHRVAVSEFKKIARFAHGHNVRIGLEPLNPVYMNTDTFLCSIAHAARLMEEVDHEAFGLFLDVWHYWEDSEAPALIRKYAGRIFGVHVSDWRLPRAFGDRLLPGAGEIPLNAMLKTIRKTGYDGVYTLEIFSDLRLPDSLWKYPAQTAAAGQKAFAKLWRQICA